ncbi:MAG: hypothetical protein M1834_007485 [Cirrosporium novae-zelandiae]|nr:MAG: hypothetical protein M1834_007485 [Cirrosporium novae-zelandiae]
MASGEAVGIHRKKRRKNDGDTGPYVIESLIQDVPLSAEGNNSNIYITCLELWEGNLYIGTSAGEILHFVSLPPDPSDTATGPTFILASRLQPIYTPLSNDIPLPGVQNIVLLPNVNRACILCNNTVTFYSLPELSPAFGNAKVSNCSWIGGLDLNLEEEQGGDVIMICATNLIRLLKMGDEREKIRSLRNIQFPGCLTTTRRESYACVADSHSYALLDVEHQQKIPLFPISSIDKSADPSSGQIEDVSSRGEPGLSRSASTGRPSSFPSSMDPQSHTRSTSLSQLLSGSARRQQSQERFSGQTPDPFDRSATQTPESPVGIQPAGATSPTKQSATDKPLPPPPGEPKATPAKPKPAPGPLKPHVLSPTPTEFLLTTGTVESEPGVGIFVNLDGDVVRGTIEFTRYPHALALDDGEEGPQASEYGVSGEEGYVLAVVPEGDHADSNQVIEIQRWDLESGESPSGKTFLRIPSHISANGNTGVPAKVGLCSVLAKGEIRLPQMGEILRMVRIKLPTAGHETPRSTDSRTRGSMERLSRERELFEPPPIEEGTGDSQHEEVLDPDWEVKRNQEEEAFAQRLGNQKGRLVAWSGNQVWWTVRNPLALKLDAALALSENLSNEVHEYIPLNRQKVIQVVNSIRGQEPKTETEYISLGYIRQKAGLMLLADILLRARQKPNFSDSERKFVQETLLDSGIDPRVIFMMVPLLKSEILEGEQGIWVHGGLVDVMEDYKLFQRQQNLDEWNLEILIMLKHYLSAWRKRKGFASIADETNVFKTIDAALLHLLLYLDQKSSQDKTAATQFRSELYYLVDHGIDCFDRAVTLLEEYRQLYVLSRLYQSRKLSRYVLATWKRIIEGEPHREGDKFEGESDVRRYLINIRDPKLVEDYGAWLSNRNPKLGVTVFVDDSRVKLEPSRVLQLLKQRAPLAVKEYLEHLVFTKNYYQYADDLVGFYLDTVISTLEKSEEARTILSVSYETYRALRAPKPTYRQFISENSTKDEWWQNRLRLLQLLGGSYDSGFSYDVSAVLTRIAPFEKELVSETIILDGRQGHHQQALRLLTHGLGDYDTAIRYCLLGGSSIFHPSSRTLPADAIPSREEQSKLFDYLLTEFLKIEDVSEQLDRTSILLERFASWFDVTHVLSIIPNSWSVELIEGFLVNSLRRLTREKNETMIVKALSGSENLQISAELIEKCELLGPKIEAVESGEA